MQKVEITKDIIEYFKSKPLTLNFAGLIKNNPAAVLYSDGESYLLVSPNTNGDGITCCIDSNNKQFVLDVLKTMQGEVSFCGVSTFVFDIIVKYHQPVWTSLCSLYVWNGQPIDASFNSLPPMDAAYYSDVSDGTPYHASKEEIEECIAHRHSAAVYVDGRPVSWCLLHFENSLGMLCTLPQYRHKGYALQVMKCITNRVIADGDIPYGYIIKGNIASQMLAQKYNMQYICDANWVGIDFTER